MARKKLESCLRYSSFPMVRAPPCAHLSYAKDFNTNRARSLLARGLRPCRRPAMVVEALLEGENTNAR